MHEFFNKANKVCDIITIQKSFELFFEMFIVIATPTICHVARLQKGKIV